MAQRATQCRKLIRQSYWEGAFYALMVGMAEVFALYYAVKNELALDKLALLSTLPVLLGSLFQWVMPLIVKNENVRSTKLFFYVVQIIGLVILCIATQKEDFFPWMFAALTLYWVGGMTSGPFWLHWIAGQIPSRSFANFLSKRNAFVALCTLAAYISTAGYLHQNSLAHNYLGVFALGTLARLLSFASQFQISKIQIPWSLPNKVRPPNYYQVPRNAIIWMIALTTLFKFTVSVSSPFFLPYMIQELHFGILEYVLLTSIPFVGRFLFLAGWGRASQDLRPFVGLQIACLGIALIPAFWAWNKNFGVYIFLELASGLLWGGFELCTILIVQRFRPGKTLKTLGLHMSIMSAASVLGAYVGSLWKSQGHSYEQLFLLSSSLRMIVAAAMVMIFLKIPTTRIKFRVYGEYLTTVLSLRTSFANIGRMLVPSRSRLAKK
jgi:hypothetical protein